ncbi:glutamate-1-semialdehyde 2,1-aminomutase [Algoriphagus aquimarinus]|uniref:Glutamate-1-semialdehyde 2,1-aminomutase n=1 Tax=Algoriphagus aquimarinus TaxID=237018 RepID=A0A5C7ADX6_9BACT|nr:glutamate-1-semialdehyde 2,1-aminomutase [Algoriphagus aquimarinus]TXE02669.1 glutamate-1-semialdehyde-2,1-aminomutase [Algoriphagus aquimarinus]
MNISKSKELFAKAQNFIPGGVNSPVRAFRAVGGEPLFIKKADGAYLYDEDGNQFIELINSWGPMLLGHNHPKVKEAVIKAMEDGTSFGAPTAREVEIAELIVSMVPSIEKVRMVNSGTEATMSAIRVARGFTGRDKFIKMEGHYHGHGDSFLIAAGSGAMTMGDPDSPGVTKGTAKDTLIAPYNNLEAIEELVAANPGEIAALILEPVPGNMGLCLPKEGYLQGLRDICTREGIILIFDEVMTGFRLAKGGAQEIFGVTPDMTTLGKIIGGGMPVGAYGGKREIMEFVSPAGPVYQAGTLSGNPIAMAAGLTMLNHLNTDSEVYAELNHIGTKLTEGIKSINQELGLDYTVNTLGSMYSLFFTDKPVFDFESAKTSDTALFGKYFQAMLKRGVYLAPSQFESLFLSTALKDDVIDQILVAHKEAMVEILGL